MIVLCGGVINTNTVFMYLFESIVWSIHYFSVLITQMMDQDDRVCTFDGSDVDHVLVDLHLTFKIQIQYQTC